MKKLAYLLPLLILAVVAMPAVVSAQTGAPTTGVGSLDPAGGGQNVGSDLNAPIQTTGDLITIVLGLVNWVAWFVALVAVLFGLYSGILFITAGGDDEKLTKAKNILLYAIVGIVVAILAFSIVAISKSIAGI